MTNQHDDSPSSEALTYKPVTQRGAWERLRRHFLAGIIVIIPAFVAIYATMVIMGMADGVFGGFVNVLFGIREDASDLPRHLRVSRMILSFMLAVLFIISVGWLSTFLFVKRAIVLGERVLQRLPVVKFFYNTPKEVLNTFAASRKDSFKRVVMIEYPRRGVYALAFATCEVVKQPEGIKLVSVFMPTTPNPTTGFLMYLPHDDVMDTNIPVEEGARMMISGGILSPDAIHTQRFAGLCNSPDLPPLAPLMRVDDPIPPPGTAGNLMTTECPENAEPDQPKRS